MTTKVQDLMLEFDRSTTSSAKPHRTTIAAAVLEIAERLDKIDVVRAELATVTTERDNLAIQVAELRKSKSVIGVDMAAPGTEHTVVCNVQRVDVKSDDPDRFAYGLTEAFRDAVEKPSAAMYRVRTFDSKESATEIDRLTRLLDASNAHRRELIKTCQEKTEHIALKERQLSQALDARDRAYKLRDESAAEFVKMRDRANSLKSANENLQKRLVEVGNDRDEMQVGHESARRLKEELEKERAITANLRAALSERDRRLNGAVQRGDNWMARADDLEAKLEELRKTLTR